MNAGQVGYLTVTLDSAIAAPATVDYTVTDGTAVEGTDYDVPTAGTVVFQPGETTAPPIAVVTTLDSSGVASKSFTVSLSNPTGELSLGASQAECTILETAPSAPATATPVTSTAAAQPPLSSGPTTPATLSGDANAIGAMTPNDSSGSDVTVGITGGNTVSEGNSVSFQLTLSDSTGADVTVYWNTQDGTASAGVNYTSANTSTVIPAGNTSATIYVGTIDDHVYEPNDEYFTVNVTGAYEDSQEDVMVTVGGADQANDQSSPVNSSGVNQPNGQSSPVNPSGANQANDQSSPTDPSGANQTNDQSLLVNVTSDGLSLPAGTSASAFIHNIDPPLAVGINNAGLVNEGGTASFQVTLSQTASATVTVYYHTRNGTASAGVNYTSASSSTTIPAGSSTAWISVGTIDDGIYEANDEDFYVDLTSASGGSGSVPSGTSANALIHNVNLPLTNHLPNCSCEPATDVDGVLVTDPPSIPGGADLSSPNAFGPEFAVTQPAQLAANSSAAAVTSQDGGVQVWNLTSGSYTPANPVTQGSLAAGSNSYGPDFVETDRDGTQWIFAGSGASCGYQAGKLEEIIPPGGSGTVSYSYTSSGWSTDTQTSSSTYQLASYTLNPAGKVAGESVQNLVSGSYTPVGSASLTYYAAGAAGGGAGDLELIESYGTGSESAEVINATFYRYYEGSYVASNTTGLQANTNPGLPDELKFTVSGAALQRLMSANSLGFNSSLPSNLDALLDSNIAPYADDFYKYDAAGLVAEIDAAGAGCSTCGGAGASTFAYAYSGSAAGANQWYARTIETRGRQPSHHIRQFPGPNHPAGHLERPAAPPRNTRSSTTSTTATAT